MNRSSARGFKLTTVIIAVLFLAVSALLTNTVQAGDMDVQIEQEK